MLTLEQFNTYIKQLAVHDWTYEYCDDNGVWRAGKAQNANLRRQAAEDLVLQQAYDAWSTFIWARPKTKETLVVLTATRDAAIEALRQQITEATPA